MKVYACPEELTHVPNYEDYDIVREQKAEDAHAAKLKEWLIAAGYKGKHTGRILRVPHADGYAQYMLADGPRSCLIHLPYGDAWDNRDVPFLPKKEVLRRIDQQDAIKKLFSESAEEKGVI